MLNPEQMKSMDSKIFWKWDPNYFAMSMSIAIAVDGKVDQNQDKSFSVL